MAAPDTAHPIATGTTAMARRRVASGSAAAVDTARGRAAKVGGGINVKQQLMPHLGFFLRASMADGRYETVDYTDVDRQLSMGIVAGGALWGRDDDEIGLAGALSGLIAGLFVSAAFIAANSSSGIAGFMLKGGQLPPLVWALLPCVLAGAWLGSRWGSGRARVPALRRSLAAVLVVAAAKFVII